MKRLSLIGSWKRIGVQLGLLAGVGLAFVGGTEPPKVEAAPEMCEGEDNCTFKKPLFGIILDNSSSMNTIFEGNVTRWNSAVNAINTTISADNGYIAGNFVLGLIRFGHDPSPNPGTKIPDDTSGLVDGQKLDVPWYDVADPTKTYDIDCTNGDAITAALEAAGPPSGGKTTGIGTWTKGAMDFAKAYIAQAKADHPEDMNARRAILLLVTDGEWTDPTGTMKLTPATQDPKITAGELFMQQQIPTYVVAIGDANGKQFADQLAMAGGTGAAIDAANPQALVDALAAVIKSIIADIVEPECAPGLPRIMVLMDASSSMLNIMNGTQHAPAGMGGWDQAREALAGMNSLFDVELDNTQKVENLVHLGLAVFGFNAPAEEKLLVQYGPCRKDNFAWALDPASSCAAPGCLDPYAKPPIKWTFQDGSIVDPMFDDKTLSHMPKCDLNAGSPNACVGSGTYTHLGLNLVQSNIAAYKAECSGANAAFPCNDATEFINILVTDGVYQSTDAQVQMPLQAMFNDGITTYVIGFGDLLNTDQAKNLLNKMADWGSGNTEDYYDANNQDQLEASLKTIIEGLTFDPCCNFNVCADVPEPTTNEPDPKVDPGDEGNETTENGETLGETLGTTTIGVDTETGGLTDVLTDTLTDPTTLTGGNTETAGETTGGTGNIGTEGQTETTQTPTEGNDDGDTEPTPTETNPTNPNPTNPNPTNPTGNETGADESGTGATDTLGEGTDDEGCGCKVEDGQGKTQGLLGTVLTLGVGGFLRRRRRASCGATGADLTPGRASRLHPESSLFGPDAAPTGA
jgi:MYXO-CTERM domain-containing protein